MTSNIALIVAAAILVIGNSFAVALPLTGDVFGTLSTGDSPYTVNGTIRVPEGQTLVVEAGVVVKLENGAGVLVEGRLLSQGTTGSPVTFTSLKDDSVGGDTNGDGAATSPTPGDWDRIEFSGHAASGTLTNTFLRYGGHWGWNLGAVRLLNGSSATMSGCEVSVSNSYGIMGDVDSWIGVSGSSFAGNTEFDIYALGRAGEISASVFSGANGVYIDQPQTVRFNGNVFRDITGLAMQMDPGVTLSGAESTSVLGVNSGLTGIDLLGRTIARDTSWSGAGLPYLLRQPVTVAGSARLTLDRGAIVKAAGGRILTEGRLYASGAAGSPVTFTSLKDDSVGGDTNGDGAATSPAPGDWDRIEFNGHAANGILTKTFLRYGGHPGWYLGAVRLLDGSSVTLSGCEVSASNSYGIMGELDSWIGVSGSSFAGNTEFDIYALGRAGEISASVFSGASGVYIDQPQRVRFNGNVFRDITGLAMQMDPGVTLSGAESTSVLGVNSGLTGIDLLGRTIARDTTWSGAGLPYLLRAPLTASSAATLTLSQGTVVKGDHGELNIQGRLQSEGTAASPVIFTSLKDDSVLGDTNGDGDAGIPAPGDWHTLQFSGAAASGTLANTFFRYGGHSGWGYGAVRLLDGAYASAMGCEVSSSSAYGFEVEGNSRLLVMHTVVSTNVTGVLSYSGSNVEMHDSSLYGNSDFAAYRGGSGQPWDATRNWWGHPTGPTHAGNPGGLGERVSDNVDYSGFLLEAPVIVDTTPPNILMTSPEPEAILSRPAVLRAAATDARGISRVMFLADGTLLGADQTASYDLAWDLSGFSDGPHTLAARAVDTSGNTAEDSLVVTLNRAPPAAPAILSPSDQFSTDISLIDVSGTAQAGATVHLLINGGLAASVPVVGTPPGTGTFQFSGVALANEGSNTLTARASDAGGMSGLSPQVRVLLLLGAPEPPYDLAASPGSDGGVDLTWIIPSTDTITTSFNLYRSTDGALLTAGAAAPASLRISTGIVFLSHTDFPDQDGAFFYGVTAVDPLGTESVLSGAAAAVSDRLPPTATFQLETGVPPLGPGGYAGRLSVSEMLVSAPILTFSPPQGSPAAVSLSPLSPYLWRGTITVTSEMSEGTAALSFQGTDLVGNTGASLGAGSALLLDTRGPGGALSLSRPSPVGPGVLDLTLTLSEPPSGIPSLSFAPEARAPVPVALSLSPDPPEGVVFVGQIVISTDTGDGLATFAYSAVDPAGNIGTPLLGAATSFLIDTDPPGAPRYLSADSTKGGFIRLSWSMPVSGSPARYFVHRDGQELPAVVIPGEDGSGVFTDGPLPDGGYQYAVSAADLAGNNGALSSPPVTRTADSLPPATPEQPQAVVDEFGNIQLTWAPGNGETPARYNLYRATSSIISISGLAPRAAVVPLYTDLPTADATYYYAVTALDAAGNEGGLSPQAWLLYDRAAPVISVTGVLEGGIYNSGRAIGFGAEDANLHFESLQGLLNGTPLASGSLVSAEGDFQLLVSASDIAGHASTRTVSFSIDKTPPVVSVAGVLAGGAYFSTVSAQVTVADARLSAATYTLTNVTLGSAEPYVPGTPIARNGPHVLRIEASDAAGNLTEMEVAFTLRIGPIAPKELAVVLRDGAGALLSWTRPEPDVVAYRVYRNSRRISSSLLRETVFTDPAAVSGGAYRFEVAAVDHEGIEGAKAVVSVPPVSMRLAGYGVSRAGAAALTRGFFDTVSLDVTNAGASGLELGLDALEIVLEGAGIPGVTSPAVLVPAGATVTVAGVVAVPHDLPASVSLRASLSLPTEPGASAALEKTFMLSAADPPEPIVELLPDALVAGAKSAIRVKFHNRGSAPADIRTGRLLDSVPAAVDDILLRLKTPEGTLLSQAGMLQTANGASGLLLGQEQVFFVSVPGASSFVFDPVELAVPEAVGSSVEVSAYVSTPAYSLHSGPLPGSRTFAAASVRASVSSVPYAATVGSDQAFYDQGSTITLSGSAQDLNGALLPGATVSVHVLSRGFERSLSTVTDETGAYSIEFNPLPNEAGAYQLAAAHPAVLTRRPQAAFTILGVELEPQAMDVSLAQNSSVPFTVKLRNTGETPITGLATQVVNPGSVPGVGLTLDSASLPSSLLAGAQAELRLKGSASASAPMGKTELDLLVRESHGFERKLKVLLDVSPSQVIPSAEPQAFELGMLAGQVRTQPITLKNLGFETWRGVRLAEPALDWVHIEGFTELGDIPPNGNANFVVRFEPPLTLANTSYALNPLLEVYADNASTVPINAGIVITSSERGGLALRIINADRERDANGNGTPAAGATVMLTSLDIPGMVMKVQGDANGLAEFKDIPAGKYQWTAEAPGFQPRSDTVTIEPGLTKTLEAILVTATVTYEWSVSPTTILDEYDVTLGLTYNTDVPAPLVMLDPIALTIEAESHVPTNGQFTVTNYGLVSAFDVELTPENPDGEVLIELPFTRIAELKPRQTVVVPYRITHGQGVSWGFGAPPLQKFQPFLHCHRGAAIGATYFYPCAAGIKIGGTCTPIKINIGPPLECGGPAAIGFGVRPASVPAGFVTIPSVRRNWVNAAIGKVVSQKSCKENAVEECILTGRTCTPGAVNSDGSVLTWISGCSYRCCDQYDDYHQGESAACECPKKFCIRSK